MEAHRQASWFCSPRNRPGSVISATAFASIRLIVFYSCAPIFCVHCTVSTGQFSPQCPRQVCFILTVPQLKGDCPWCPIAGGYAVFFAVSWVNTLLGNIVFLVQRCFQSESHWIMIQMWMWICSLEPPFKRCPMCNALLYFDTKCRPAAGGWKTQVKTI